MGKERKVAKFVNDKTHVGEPAPNNYDPTGPDSHSK
jgi:hypothetical protein